MYYFLAYTCTHELETDQRKRVIVFLQKNEAKQRILSQVFKPIAVVRPVEVICFDFLYSVIFYLFIFASALEF